MAFPVGATGTELAPGRLNRANVPLSVQIHGGRHQGIKEAAQRRQRAREVIEQLGGRPVGNWPLGSALPVRPPQPTPATPSLSVAFASPAASPASRSPSSRWPKTALPGGIAGEPNGRCERHRGHSRQRLEITAKWTSPSNSRVPSGPNLAREQAKLTPHAACRIEASSPIP
jgi:hypothetical protein